MLDDLGLKCCGTHIRIDTLLGDALPATVEFNQILGNKYLIVPGLAEEYRNSRAAWLRTAGIFNEIAERLKPYGMLTGYHNHFIEFQPMDGELPWDTFFGNARQDVIMQVDIGNALHGGGDPIPYLARYPGRAITVHLKEYSATDKLAILGEGMCRGPASSTCARPRAAPSGTSSSRRATSTRRWRSCPAVWTTCAEWEKRKKITTGDTQSTEIFRLLRVLCDSVVQGGFTCRVLNSIRCSPKSARCASKRWPKPPA